MVTAKQTEKGLGLTGGKKYKVISEGDSTVLIMNDFNHYYLYLKEKFEEYGVCIDEHN